MENKFAKPTSWKRLVVQVLCEACVVGCVAAITTLALRPKVDLDKAGILEGQRQARVENRENINAVKAEFYVKLSEVGKSLEAQDARMDAMDQRAAWMDRAASNLLMVAPIIAKSITREECREIADEAARARAAEALESMAKLAESIAALEAKVSEAQTGCETGEWAARKAAKAMEILMPLESRVSALEGRPVVDVPELDQLREAVSALAVSQTNIAARMSRILKALSD